MKSLVIELPETLAVDNMQEKIRTLQKLYDDSLSSPSEKVVFDFSHCKTVSPAGMVLIQMWRDDLIENGKKTFYRKSDPETQNFLQKMHLLPGYIEKQNEIVEKTYFHPLCSCNSISDCSEAHKKIIANVVQRDCVKDETYAAVDYMINELWDNAGVHGYECYDAERYPKPVYICALEYNDCYEICIGDRGQGIFESLRKNNDKLSSKNKKVAIQSAIQNGISGHPNGSPGFGLYSAAEFIREADGRLHIWSSGCYLVVSGKNDKIYSSDYNRGTIISFVFKKSAVMPYSKVVGSSCDTDTYIKEVIGGMFDD